MAILKDLIVLGNSRITSDLYAKTIYEDNVSLSSKYAAYSHTHSQYLTGQDHYSSGITAQTTQALYPIKISASGHITAYGSAITSLPASDVYSWAKASTKPSYTLDEVSDGSTRKLANYLPLGGGTLTGALNITSASWGNQLTLHRTGTDGTWGPSIRFYNNNSFLGTIGIDTSGNFYKGDDGSVKYKIWHEGNDGSGSGLDADTLDGNHANAFATSEHTHNKIICLGQYVYTNIAKDIPVNALSYKIISSGGNVLGDSQYELLHLPWSEGDWGNYLIFGANTGRVGVKYKSTGDVRELLTSSNYTDYTVKKDGTGASGTWGINVSGTAGGVSWDNVSNKPAIVYKKNNSYFYPFIGSSNYSKWYKVTFPWSGYAPSTNRWLMTTMELVLGGSYSNGANGKIFLSYYFNINSSNVWTASDVRGIGIGNKLTHNSVQIKYDIANPGIFYIHVNESGNIYNSFAIENLTANDSAPSFDFLNTTITTISIDDIPSTADKTVPITFIESTNGSDLLSNGNTIWTSANDGSGSGLDADTLDGNHANAFATSSHQHYIGTTSTQALSANQALTGITSIDGILALNATRGAYHFEMTGPDADYGVARFIHTANQGSGSPGNYTATLAVIDQRTNNLSGAYEPTFYINRTGATTTPDLMGVNNTSGRVFTITTTGNVGVGTSTPSYKLHISGGLLGITANDNTVYIGSGNSSWCHFVNSANRPFYFSHAIHATNAFKIYDTDYNINASTSILNTLRLKGTDLYMGSASGSQCHQQYDTSNECLKFLFD